MGYVFDPDTLHEIANQGVGLPFADMTRVVAEAAARTFPGHVDTTQDYIFNLTSGSCGMMKILHASVTEYLIIFGSSIGTEAFSGRYDLDIWDFVMTGEMLTYTEERCGEKLVSGPGDQTLLRRGTVKGWRVREDTWMLEYGRGFLPSALPLALGDVLLSAMDWRVAAQLLRIYGRLGLKELLHGKL